MSRCLFLTSDNRASNETTDSFTININPPVPISGNWSMALEQLTMWYSYYNISSDYGNQTFRYYNGTTWKNITIPAGLYTIENIYSYIKAQLKNAGDYAGVVAGVDVHYIILAPNYNTFKLDVTVSNSYQVDFSVGNLYQLVGFTPIIVTTSQSGINNVNITNGVDKINIHIDCITGSYSGSGGNDVIYSFPIDGAPSSLVTIKPIHLLKLAMNKSGFLDRIKVYITDQQGENYHSMARL